MAYLLERDALNGKDGKAFLIKDGKVIELFHLKNLNVKGDFRESDFTVVGTRIIQIRTSGIKYTGTMDVYYGTPIFNQILQEYQNNGKQTYFKIQIINDDKTSTVGKQTVTLSYCKFSNVPIALLDADSDALREQVNFSFTDVEILREFHAPSEYGGNKNRESTPEFG